MSFKVEYKRGSGGPAMFQRQVRFQVDISVVSRPEETTESLYAITFTLISGTTECEFSISSFYCQIRTE